MRILAKLLGPSLVFAMASAPSLADACSPPLPELTSSLPASGDTYPANAALFFYGYGISLDGVSVSVDGRPASLVPAPDVAGLDSSDLVARIEPVPAAGQKVTVEGDFCAQSGGCGVETITFTAGEPDSQSPPSPAAMSFDLHDYPDFVSSGGDCQSDSGLGYWVDVTAEPPGAGESPVGLRVQAFRDATFQEFLFSMSTFVTSSETGLSSRQTDSVLGGLNAPEALCFRASLIDAAGNEAANIIHVCKPCRYRKDPEGVSEFSPPPEPEWTPADVYPGGPCGDGAGGSGGSGAGGSGSGSGGGGEGGDGGGGDDTDGVVGCGCEVPVREGPGAGALSLAVLSLAAALRRRRPADVPGRNGRAQ